MVGYAISMADFVVIRRKARSSTPSKLRGR